MLRMASIFHSLHAISSQLAPVSEGGIETLEADTFTLQCLQTPTGAFRARCFVVAVVPYQRLALFGGLCHTCRVEVLCHCTTQDTPPRPFPACGVCPLHGLRTQGGLLRAGPCSCLWCGSLMIEGVAVCHDAVFLRGRTRSTTWTCLFGASCLTGTSTNSSAASS